MASPAHTVVLVEDDRVVAHMYMIGLQARGFRIVLCDSGDTLFGRLASLDADVIVLDWLLPGVDGAQVFAALRRDDRVRDVPVLVLSSLSHPDAERTAALKSGVVAWLEKAHTTPRMLADVISDLLAAGAASA
ncbi:MAG TPA: response regulator [Candidatus Dormibacteraeota bacterium]|nr:response regulator [Candidatus Dormibacteraeota bacterium]